VRKYVDNRCKEVIVSRTKLKRVLSLTPRSIYVGFAKPRPRQRTVKLHVTCSVPKPASVSAVLAVIGFDRWRDQDLLEKLDAEAQLFTRDGLHWRFVGRMIVVPVYILRSDELHLLSRPSASLVRFAVFVRCVRESCLPLWLSSPDQSPLSLLSSSPD